MGVERLIFLLETFNLIPEEVKSSVDISLVAAGDELNSKGLLLAERLRRTLPHLRLQVVCGEGSFKAKIKKATATGAKFGIAIKQNYLEDQQLTLMGLSQDLAPINLDEPQLVEWLKEQF